MRLHFYLACFRKSSYSLRVRGDPRWLWGVDLVLAYHVSLKWLNLFGFTSHLDVLTLKRISWKCVKLKLTAVYFDVVVELLPRS